MKNNEINKFVEFVKKREIFGGFWFKDDVEDVIITRTRKNMDEDFNYFIEPIISILYPDNKLPMESFFNNVFGLMPTEIRWLFDINWSLDYLCNTRDHFLRRWGILNEYTSKEFYESWKKYNLECHDWIVKEIDKRNN